MKKTLYIIHGWTYTIEPWGKAVELLRKQGVNVVQLRVPGLTTPSQKVWTIDDYVAWLDAKISDKKSAIVLGHSNGGRIALHHAATHPNAFSHLILLNSAGLFFEPPATSLKRKLARAAAKIGKPIAKIPGLRKVFYRLIGSDYGRAPENMKQTLSNMLSSDKTFRPETVKTKKIDILWGAKDTVTPLGMGRALHVRLPQSTFRQFDEWTHAPYIAFPEELAAAIMEVIS